MPLEDVKTAGTYAGVLEQRVIKHVKDRLAGESLPKRLGVLHCLCPPVAGQTGVEGYTYDGQRIQEMDRLRQGVVHGGNVTKPLPHGEEDLTFLFRTCSYLLALVNHKYGVRADPEYFGRLATSG